MQRSPASSRHLLSFCFRTISAVSLLAFLTVQAYAKSHDSIPERIIHSIEFDARPAYIFPTNPFFKGFDGERNPNRNALSGHLKYGFKFGPDTYFGQQYPHAVQGIGIGYNTFFNTAEIGNPLAVYVFQTSRIVSLAPNLSLDYEWNFGASFGWKKYDAQTNPWNIVVGSKINAYMAINILLNWQINSRTSLKAGIGAAHYSNGNTNYPNSGVNTLNGSIGITRFFGPAQTDSPATCRKTKEKPAPHVSYDLIVYGSTKRKGIYPEGLNPMLVPGSFAVAGINVNPLYNFTKYFRAGLSLDMQYDESANIINHIANKSVPSDPSELKFYRPPFIEQFSAGLSARAEFIMPIFSINLGIGRNFIGKGKDLDAFYQILALKTDITKNFFLHVGYQLYKFKEPNSLMLGVGIRFNAD